MAAQEDRSRLVASGTAEGLLEFADYLAAKGYATPATTTPWKSAAKQVFSTVEGETEWKSKDVRGLDLGEYLTRFETMTRGQYKTQSLAAYRARLRRALEAYEAYLRDGRTPTPGQPRARRSVEKTGGASAGLQGGGETSVTTPAAPSPVASLVEYPFPLRSGMAYLRLPRELDKGDAERLATFVRTLVFEPQRQLEKGGKDGAEASSG